MPLDPSLPEGRCTDSVAPVHAYLSSLAPESRRVMGNALVTAAGILGKSGATEVEWHRLTAKDFQLMRDHLNASYAPRTVNRVLSAVRGVLRAEARRGKLAAKELVDIIAVANVPLRDVEPGRVIEREDIEKLIRTCMNDGSAFGARDGAMISLLYTCGLRSKEVVRLDASQIRLSEEKMFGRVLGGTLRLPRGNGPIILLDSVGYAMRDWLSVRGSGSGPLFMPIRKNGKIVLGKGLTPQAVSTIVGRRASEAGIGRVTPRDLRATFTIDAIRSGAGFVEIASVLGSKSLDRVAALHAANKRGDERLFVPLEDYLHDYAPRFYSPYTRVRSRWAGAAERIRKRAGRKRRR